MIRAGLQQVRQTLADMRRWRMVGLFLLAYWLYIDGVDTIVRMAVDYGLALGFSTHDLLLALLLTQFIGFPAALGFGKLGERLGARRGILLGIGAYILITIWGSCISQPWCTPWPQPSGWCRGDQSLSRSFYARLIPAEHSGELFGVYNMLGKCAAVVGPVLMGWVSLMTGSPRTSILSLLVLFIGGALLLARVDEEGRPAPGQDPGQGGWTPIHQGLRCNFLFGRCTLCPRHAVVSQGGCPPLSPSPSILSSAERPRIRWRETRFLPSQEREYRV